MREESSFIVVEVSMERAGDEGQDLHAGGDPCCRERGLLADGVGDDGGGLAVGVDDALGESARCGGREGSSGKITRE